MAILKIFQYILSVVALINLSSAAVFDPYLYGPYWTTRMDTRRITTLGLEENLNVWSPVDPGNYPILFFLDGFGAIIPGEAYQDVMNQVASHGFVVVASWRIVGSFNYTIKVEEFTDTIAWCKDNLEQKLYKNNVSAGMNIEYDNSFGMGHSAGSHIMIQYLEGGCNDMKGVILSSPVDTPAPTNCITVGEQFNFDIPALVLPAGLDNVPGNLNSEIPCAPDKISNMRFWNALSSSSPRWLVNATDYGHGDYLNQKFLDIVIETGFCSVKSDWTLDDFVTYRSFVAGQITSFLKGLLETDCETYLPYLENTFAMPVNAIGEYDRVVQTCPRASCVFN